ncbi:hypothetical protein V495_00894 [Pseudogymnoascus sp. VKM F-4514 (FW-929)]|nr:hypothetical protein V490_01757 [Pseudogymnoascus sp. VKM F-3557]KFY48938.1 hypothetical protein V495_00894 [Pseudogymnoascus sp. VKM F-4514 (FW-929)]KFY56427.1 hypothetical protein V497_06271 [Pseudogymnoascus sp. VKM F-4516 (FW-969)]
MMYSILTSAIVGASVVLANVIPAGSINRSAKAVELVDMIYEGPITPGGETYTLSGDAKGIYEQILQLNPSYNITDFNIPAPQEAKRAVTAIHCDVTANYAPNNRIRDGINYLNSLGAGYCRLGPAVVTRISCSWSAAIYWGNNNNHDIAIACNYLGYGLSQRAYDQCHHDDVISGQAFDQGNYYTLLSGDNQFGEGHC